MVHNMDQFWTQNAAKIELLFTGQDTFANEKVPF